jgi:MYND finger/Ankyrin repeats (3 copies)
MLRQFCTEYGIDPRNLFARVYPPSTLDSENATTSAPYNSLPPSSAAEPSEAQRAKCEADRPQLSCPDNNNCRSCKILRSELKQVLVAGDLGRALEATEQLAAIGDVEMALHAGLAYHFGRFVEFPNLSLGGFLRLYMEMPTHGDGDGLWFPPDHEKAKMYLRRVLFRESISTDENAEHRWPVNTCCENCGAAFKPHMKSHCRSLLLAQDAMQEGDDSQTRLFRQRAVSDLFKAAKHDPVAALYCVRGLLAQSEVDSGEPTSETVPFGLGLSTQRPCPAWDALFEEASIEHPPVWEPQRPIVLDLLSVVDRGAFGDVSTLLLAKILETSPDGDPNIPWKRRFAWFKSCNSESGARWMLKHTRHRWIFYALGVQILTTSVESLRENDVSSGAEHQDKVPLVEITRQEDLLSGMEPLLVGATIRNDARCQYALSFCYRYDVAAFNTPANLTSNWLHIRDPDLCRKSSIGAALRRLDKQWYRRAESHGAGISRDVLQEMEAMIASVRSTSDGYVSPVQLQSVRQEDTLSSQAKLVELAQTDHTGDQVRAHLERFDSSISQCDEQGRNALAEAFRGRNIRAARALMEKNPCLCHILPANDEVKFKHTILGLLLHDPAESIPEIRALKSLQALDMRRTNGFELCEINFWLNDDDAELASPLILAIRANLELVVWWLLKCGEVDVNGEVSGRTPLFEAVQSNNPALVRMLLEFGADSQQQCNGCSDFKDAKEGEEKSHCASMRYACHFCCMRYGLPRRLLPIEAVIEHGNLEVAMLILEHEDRTGVARFPGDHYEDPYDDAKMSWFLMGNGESVYSQILEAAEAYRVGAGHANLSTIAILRGGELSTYYPGLTKRKQRTESQNDVQKKCFGCGTPANSMKICAVCRVATYCSKECQKRHWKEHKGACSKRAARRR